jgi:hypothetical protein
MSQTKDPDPSLDPALIGMLIGMSGGTITDAMMAKFALDRFEQMNGRKATANDLGLIVGMMQASKES